MFKTRFISMLVLLLMAVSGARAAWTGGTYTATANENVSAISVTSDATLTIATGVTVTINNGLNITSGTLTVTGPGTLVVTGAKGNDGANGGYNGYDGGTGGVAISGNIIVQGGATVTATGGNGGNGGNADDEAGIGGNGGKGGNAFAGTLTYKSGTVTANGGSGGSGGSGGWDGGKNGSSGSAGNAFANDVDFTQTTGYSVTNGTSTIGSVLNQRKVVISGGTPIPTTVAVTGVTLAPTSATLTLGETETVTLTATVLPDDATDKTVTWTTSNASVATVADGVVTAVGAGTATITATATNGTADTSDDMTATCEVTVSPAGYSVALKEGTDDAANWQGKAGEGEYQALPLTGLEAGTAVSVKYNGTKKVKSVKAVKKSSAPTLKDALADGATVVITYTWSGTNVTTFTYTNNGGNYTGNTTGVDAEYFDNHMSMDGTTLVFSAINPEYTSAFVAIRFYTDTNEYYFANKGSLFTSFTISVNGTDVTSQLKEVK